MIRELYKTQEFWFRTKSRNIRGQFVVRISYQKLSGRKSLPRTFRSSECEVVNLKNLQIKPIWLSIWDAQIESPKLRERLGLSNWVLCRELKVQIVLKVLKFYALPSEFKDLNLDRKRVAGRSLRNLKQLLNFGSFKSKPLWSSK